MCLLACFSHLHLRVGNFLQCTMFQAVRKKTIILFFEIKVEVERAIFSVKAKKLTNFLCIFHQNLCCDFSLRLFKSHT